jgi:beta-lactamase regulating signal transducer with metallopeptidase domain
LRKEKKMDNLLLYLLRVSAGTMLFYLCYILFFSKDTFYLRNRIFLIGLLLLSIIIPVLKVFNIFAVDSTIEHTNSMNSIILSGTIIGATVSEKITSFDLNSLFIWLYFSISVFFLLRALTSMARTLMIIRRGSIQDTKFPKVVLSDMEHPPFSFFPYVVIPKKTFESGDYLEILAHEKAHIRQGHTFDLLLSELLIVFLWFNPFMWLIKRSMVLNHEYLADNFSIKSSSSIKEYQYKLLNISKGLMNVPLAHNFSSLIKNRIVMINKRPTRNYAALKSIIILPVAAILFVMFSFKPESIPTNNGYQEPLFSKSSESEILKFLAINTGYPQEAKNSFDTGKVFVVVKMNKGGIIKECKAFTEKNGINVPLLEEIVIVGYKPSTGPSAAKSEKATGNEHPSLKTECLRVANKLMEVKIPEWKDKDIEFEIAFKFTLK